MKKSMPIRIDDELYTAATEAASVMSRSTTQQVSHWARIGRELEASPEVSVEEVAKVLQGEREYDAIGLEEQAVARACWSERMSALKDALRLDREFAAAGRPYAELDSEGKVVRREPKSSRRTKAG